MTGFKILDDGCVGVGYRGGAKVTPNKEHRIMKLGAGCCAKGIPSLDAGCVGMGE